MSNYTLDTHVVKRSIVRFARKLTQGAGKSQSKFVMQMIYGMCHQQSCLLSHISDALKDECKKINTIERLARHLRQELSPIIHENYWGQVNLLLPEKPLVFVDDSDIVKPHGKAFESLGKVRDGSSKDHVVEKGYRVTEMVAITATEKQPVSLYSHIHSSSEPKYSSANTITFQGLNSVSKRIAQPPLFVFDRGYDMNALFRYMHQNNHQYLVRLTERRKIFYKGKWYKSTTLRDSRKGKIKTNVLFQGEIKTCYISHLNVRLTANKTPVKLVLVYGLGQVPMMLVTNTVIHEKNDVVQVLRAYLSRWRIEEYFRFKKQIYGLENIRVRKLLAINNLNQLLTYSLTFIAMLTEKRRKTMMSQQVLKRSNSLRSKIYFYYYQMAKGIKNILSFAKTGINQYLKIEQRPKYIQLSFLRN